MQRPCAFRSLSSKFWMRAVAAELTTCLLQTRLNEIAQCINWSKRVGKRQEEGNYRELAASASAQSTAAAILKYHVAEATAAAAAVIA